MLNKIFSLIIIFLNTLVVFSQTPNYELLLKNDIKTAPNEYEFDITIRPKAPTNSFQLAALQCILTFNTEIGSSLSISIIPSSSQLASTQIPNSVNISGDLIQISSRTPPGAGNGTIVNNELRVARFKLTDNVGFSTQGANLSWRNSLDPYTKVNAYVSGLNTSITSSSNHLNQLDNLPLPVELTNFSAVVIKNMVNLNWQTKTEMNNYGFEIERKASDAEIGEADWEKIGFISGYGTSNTTKDYFFTDSKPYGSSKFYYRLKQINIGGNFKHSDEVEVNLLPNEFVLFQNYPNPFNPVTNIKFALPQNTKITLSVFNILGEEVAALLSEEKQAGIYEVRFDGSKLSSGTYFFRLTADDYIQIKTMSLIK